MQFSTPLLRGTLIRRYKRFFADIELENGELIVAHCPNTGAMTGCAEPGFIAYVSPANNPKRKLQYTWELAQDQHGHFIGINTHTANKLVAEALNNKALPLFNSVSAWKPEVTPPGADSRFDFSLTTETGISYAEVKSVTLARGERGFFPDAVTSRGTKHCLTLAELARQGIPTQLWFCVQHTGITSVCPAQDIDPDYARAVRTARDAGVQIHAFGCAINEQKIEINQSLPVIM